MNKKNNNVKNQNSQEGKGFISNIKTSGMLLLQFTKTINKFFPEFNEWLDRINDPRMPEKVKYIIREIIFISIIFMSLPLKSRRRYNEDFRRYEETRRVLTNLFDLKLESGIPHGDSLEYLWEKLPIEELEKIRTKMIRKLISGKYLKKFKFKLTYTYTIAEDGVEIYRTHKKHCDNCLHTTKNENTEYYHRVFEAKLVSSYGFVFSICSEFIENDGVLEDDKQDCELKAFKRLNKKLKQIYPKLKMTILGDSLFPTGPNFNICKENGWYFIFVIKETVLPTVWEDFWGLCNIGPNALNVKEDPQMIEKDGIVYLWQNDLWYEGKDFKGKINILVMLKKDKEGKYKVCNSYITNIRIDKENCIEISLEGNLRWKIENEGFNIQKNNEVYELEHMFSKHPNGMKVIYLLIQIAHIINQLFLMSDLFKVRLYEFESDIGCLKSLLTAFTTLGWSEELETRWDSIKIKKYQARWP